MEGGGQGVLTIGKILASAFGSEGKNVVLTKSYGGTARGGASKTELVVTDLGEEVDFPEVLSPDLLVAMTQEAFDAYIEDVDPSGVAVVDSSYVKEMRADVSKSIISIPFSRLAFQRLGDELLANLFVVLIVGRIFVISNERLVGAIRKNLPQLGNEIIDKAIDITGTFDENIKDGLEKRTNKMRVERPI